MKHRWKLVSLAVLLGCALAAVRRDRPLERVRTFPVRGRVVLASNTPVPGGRVHFHLRDNPDEPAAFAELERDGTFTVNTYGRSDGAMPGSYILTIHPLSYKSGNPRHAAGSVKIPNRYQSEATSDLVVEVVPGENDLGTIRLRP